MRTVKANFKVVLRPKSNIRNECNSKISKKNLFKMFTSRYFPDSSAVEMDDLLQYAYWLMDNQYKSAIQYVYAAVETPLDSSERLSFTSDTSGLRNVQLKSLYSKVKNDAEQEIRKVIPIIPKVKDWPPMARGLINILVQTGIRPIALESLLGNAVNIKLGCKVIARKLKIGRDKNTCCGHREVLIFCNCATQSCLIHGDWLPRLPTDRTQINNAFKAIDTTPYAARRTHNMAFAKFLHKRDSSLSKALSDPQIRGRLNQQLNWSSESVQSVGYAQGFASWAVLHADLTCLIPIFTYYTHGLEKTLDLYRS